MTGCTAHGQRGHQEGAQCRRGQRQRDLGHLAALAVQQARADALDELVHEAFLELRTKQCKDLRQLLQRAGARGRCNHRPGGRGGSQCLGLGLHAQLVGQRPVLLLVVPLV
ncbi:hypothetical protein EON65_42390, partial [archaeon]